MFRARLLTSGISGADSRNKVRVLFGARQTGKTMLLRHALAPSATRFFNLQEGDLRRRLEADPSAFRREVLALPKGVKNIVVDEIQKVPAVLDEVQALYDQTPRRWQFFLTGSSARRLRRSSANLLPGRSHAFRLHPVCRWEMAGRDNLEIPAPRTKESSSPSLFQRPSLERILRRGCLPGVLGESQGSGARTLETYVATYLEEEIRREAAVRELGPFMVFLRLAGAEAGRQVNLAKLSQESGVAATTLKTYYQVLVDTFVGNWVHPYSGRARTRLLTSPRFLFFDVGVRNAAAEFPLRGKVTSLEGGPLLEQWVGQELITRASYLGESHRVTFWRTTSGAEVDFVWESPEEDVPIEVKWTERPRPEDARHLERFLDLHGERAERGLLVCRVSEPQQLTNRVRAVGWDRI